MNTAQLDSVLRRILPRSKVNFLGVFARDHVPTTIHNYPACFVANTDPSSKPGEHWVAFYLTTPQKIDFFDSYGFHPRAYGFTLPVTSYNHTQYQSLKSNVCGQYCILYLYSRTLCRCSSKLAWNDSKVAKWVRSLKASKSPCTNHPCIQTCKCKNK